MFYIKEFINKRVLVVEHTEVPHEEKILKYEQYMWFKQRL